MDFGGMVFMLAGAFPPNFSFKILVLLLSQAGGFALRGIMGTPAGRRGRVVAALELASGPDSHLVFCHAGRYSCIPHKDDYSGYVYIKKMFFQDTLKSTPSILNISHFEFSRYINFNIYLDIIYI